MEKQVPGWHSGSTRDSAEHLGQHLSGDGMVHAGTVRVFEADLSLDARSLRTFLENQWLFWDKLHKWYVASILRTFRF